MEIIKKGTLKKYKVECPRCGCIFICDENEIGVTFKPWDKSKLKDTYKTVSCPYCNTVLKEYITKFEEVK